jgi:hypothetical protein
LGALEERPAEDFSRSPRPLPLLTPGMFKSQSLKLRRQFKEFAESEGET